jgi:lysozyme family protein
MALFEIAVSVTVDPAHEGGYQNNPEDSGNWTGGKIGVGELKGTNFGISAAEFPSTDILNLTVTQAKAIYLEHYWNPLYNQIKDQFICNKIFDLGVLFGRDAAVKELQEVLQQFNLKLDGQFGPKTLAAVNDSEPVSLLAAYKTKFVAKVIADAATNPEQRPFVSDYIRRINS